MAEACRNCGTELPEGASFCAECGTAAPSAEAPVPPPQPWPAAPPPYPPTLANHPPTAAPSPYPFPTVAPVDAPISSGTSPRNTIAGVLGVVGALVLGVSSFLAWAEVSLGFVGRTQTVSAWDWFDNNVSTGPLIAGLALLGAALAGLMFAQVAPAAVRVVVVAIGGLSLGLAAFALSDILDRRGDLTTIGQAEVTVQYGLWLAIAGALFVLVSGLVATDARRPSAP